MVSVARFMLWIKKSFCSCLQAMCQYNVIPSPKFEVPFPLVPLAAAPCSLHLPRRCFHGKSPSPGPCPSPGPAPAAPAVAPQLWPDGSGGAARGIHRGLRGLLLGRARGVAGGRARGGAVAGHRRGAVWAQRHGLCGAVQ